MDGILWGKWKRCNGQLSLPLHLFSGRANTWKRRLLMRRQILRSTWRFESLRLPRLPRSRRRKGLPWRKWPTTQSREMYLWSTRLSKVFCSDQLISLALFANTRKIWGSINFILCQKIYWKLDMGSVEQFFCIFFMLLSCWGGESWAMDLLGRQKGGNKLIKFIGGKSSLSRL